MDYIKAEIEERLSDKRKTHTYGVMDTAEKLAVRYGADVEKTRLAALCHDLYRSTPQKELNELVKAKGLSKKYIDNKDLSHGRLAACTMEDKFGISDEEVLNAVRYHTTGRAGMCLLEKIIYLADAIEPGRNYPGIEEQRALAFEDLDKALLGALEKTIELIEKKGFYLDKDTIEARDWIISVLENKKGEKI